MYRFLAELRSFFWSLKPVFTRLAVNAAKKFRLFPLFSKAFSSIAANKYEVNKTLVHF